MIPANDDSSSLGVANHHLAGAPAAQIVRRLAVPEHVQRPPAGAGALSCFSIVTSCLNMDRKSEKRRTSLNDTYSMKLMSRTAKAVVVYSTRRMGSGLP